MSFIVTAGSSATVYFLTPITKRLITSSSSSSSHNWEREESTLFLEQRQLILAYLQKVNTRQVYHTSSTIPKGMKDRILMKFQEVYLCPLGS